MAVYVWKTIKNKAQIGIKCKEKLYLHTCMTNIVYVLLFSFIYSPLWKIQERYYFKSNYNLSKVKTKDKRMVLHFYSKEY